jgi:hypothetical protein
MGVVYGGGRPFLASNPEQKWVVTTPTVNYGVVMFFTDAQVAAAPNSYYPVTCSMGSDGFMSCTTTFSNTFTTMFSCGAYLYFGRPTWAQASCTAVKFKLVTTTYL